MPWHYPTPSRQAIRRQAVVQPVRLADQLANEAPITLVANTIEELALDKLQPIVRGIIAILYYGFGVGDELRQASSKKDCDE